jgi:hypothetical protein
VVGAASGEVTGWNLDASRGRPVFKARAEGGLIGLHHAPEPGRVLTVSQRGALQCWNLDSDRIDWSQKIPDVPHATAMTQDRDLLVVATAIISDPKRWHGKLRFYQPIDGSEVGEAPFSGSVRRMDFSPDGTRLLILCNPDRVQVLDTQGRRLFAVNGHPSRVTGGEFSPDGLRLLTWDDLGNARLWDAHTGAPLTAFWSSPGGIAHATFAADGWRIGSGDIPPTGTLWDAGCPLPKGWDRTALTAALVRQGSLEALRRAAWLNPKDGTILRRLAKATRQESTDPWRDSEARFLERRTEGMTDAVAR